jgi:arginyl-tRNA synthetase
MPLNLPTLPEVPGADPSRAVLDAFKISIAKRVAGALPPLTVDQVYQGVDYGKKGVDFTIALPRFRLPGKVDVLARTVIDQVCNPRTCFGLALFML